MRIDILNALENDFNITGIKKVWKYLPDIFQIPDSSLPSINVQFGTESYVADGEDSRIYEVPVILVVYIKSLTDTNNEGLLRTEAENWIHKFKALDTYSNLRQLDEVISLEYITGTPYLNTGIENRGFLIIEFKLTYKGD